MRRRTTRRRWPAIAMLAASASPAAAEEAPICTDRPSKANAVCTVPKGKIQIETDAANWTRIRSGGTRTDLIYTNPTLKLGLGPNTDIEANLAPLIESRTRTSAGVSTVRGPGDLFLRVKQRVTDPDGKVQLGLIPFVKLPTAKRGVGNGRWEGGLAVPTQLSLSPKTSLTLGPELDLLADGDGRGRHVQFVGLVNIGRTLSPRLTVYGELWTARNYDPAGTMRQHSLDGAVAYLLSPRLQIDAGLNLGLNRTTPDLQLCGGVSTRF